MDIIDIGQFKQKQKRKMPISFENFTFHLTKVETENLWLKWQAAYIQGSLLQSKL